MARINCKPPLSGKLVTQEEKERILEERHQRSSSPDKLTDQSVVGLVNHCNEIDTANAAGYTTQPNKEERIDNELTMMSSDNESDSEQLLTSNEYIHKKALTWAYTKYFIKSNTTKYRNWFFILFKNGYWRTTIILWYLW